MPTQLAYSFKRRPNLSDVGYIINSYIIKLLRFACDTPLYKFVLIDWLIDWANNQEQFAFVILICWAHAYWRVSTYSERSVLRASDKIICARLGRPEPSALMLLGDYWVIIAGAPQMTRLQSEDSSSVLLSLSEPAEPWCQRLAGLNDRGDGECTTDWSV